MDFSLVGGREETATAPAGGALPCPFAPSVPIRWRSVKYEEVYLYACEGVAAARAGLGRYFRFYNAERRHQRPGRTTPDAVYADSGSWPKAA